MRVEVALKDYGKLMMAIKHVEGKEDANLFTFLIQLDDYDKALELMNNTFKSVNTGNDSKLFFHKDDKYIEIKPINYILT